MCALAAPNFIYSPAGSNRSVLLLQCDRWRQMCLCVCGGASAAVRLLLPPPTPLKDNKKIFSFVYWTERPPTGPAQREVGERKKGRRPTWWRAPRPSHQYNKKKKVKKNWREEEENAHSSGPEENRSFFSKRIQRNPSVLDSPFPFFSSLERPEKSKCCKRNLRRVSLRLYNSIVFSRRQQKRHREFFSRRDQLTQ